jgi:hypothetical protein
MKDATLVVSGLAADAATAEAIRATLRAAVPARSSSPTRFR